MGHYSYADSTYKLRESLYSPEPPYYKNEKDSEEAFRNIPLDNLAVHVSSGDCVPKESGIFHDELRDVYQKCFGWKGKAPLYAFLRPIDEEMLYLHFIRHDGIREIARKLRVSPGYVSKTISPFRQILGDHIERVFPPHIKNRKKEYTFEFFMCQQTVTQIAGKYKVSHQAVSKSIRRAKKRVVAELRKTVASRQRIEGQSKIFAQNRLKKSTINSQERGYEQSVEIEDCVAARESVRIRRGNRGAGSICIERGQEQTEAIAT